MTDTLTKQWLGKKVKITTNIGTQAWHYIGIVLSVTDTHITINDSKEGNVSIPLSNAMIREVGE